MTMGKLETKFHGFNAETGLGAGAQISGYASLFGSADQGGDIVQAGAYAKSLASLAQKGRSVKMLWQHDPTQPIGVWEEVREDDKGLFVKGRILADIQAGREALALIEAGAIDGLSIGYRTKRAEKTVGGQRLLHELELWEVSLVTFPMLPEARVEGSQGDAQLANDLAQVIADARRELLA
jgi:HK97 family phage prohead protease